MTAHATFVFQLADVAVGLRADPALVEGCREFFGVYAQPARVSPVRWVRVVEAEALRRGGLRLVDEAVVGARPVEAAGSRLVRDSADADTLLVRDSDDSLLIVMPPRRPCDRIVDVARKLRSCMLLALEEAGHTFLHAGAVALEGNAGVAVCGDKFAGKTTTVIALIEAGCAFVSNDKIALRRVGAGVEAIGFPVRAGVRSGTLRCSSALSAWARRNGAAKAGKVSDDGRVHIHPEELARMFGTRVRPSCPLRAILVPQLVPGLTAPQLVAVPPEQGEALLRRQVLGGLAQLSKFDVALEELFPRSLPRSPDVAQLARLPVFLLRQGGYDPSATRSLALQSIRPRRGPYVRPLAEVSA